MSNLVVNKKKNSMIDYMNVECYDTSCINVVPFSKADYTLNGWEIGFGNMRSEFPVTFFGHHFSCPETAYIACYYGLNTPECINIQHEIQQCTNGKTCKGRYRKNREYTQYGRSDFHGSPWHFNLMLYLVWLKCQYNKHFADMLLAIPDDWVIIENQNGFNAVNVDGDYSLGDWGCKNTVANAAYRSQAKIIKSQAVRGKVKLLMEIKLATGQTGVWTGMNHQGKILMACREALRTGSVPPIDYESLNAARIYLFGSLLQFGVNEQ